MLYRWIIKYLRKLRDIYYQMLELPDSPKKIAQGVALGTALEFLPLPFISIPISFIVAKLLRFNAVAATMAVIFFKWAFPLCFIFNYHVGRILLGDTMPPPALLDITYLASPDALLGYMKSLGYPFLIGAAIDSTVASIITYFVVKSFLDYYRRKKNSNFVKLSYPEKII